MKKTLMSMAAIAAGIGAPALAADAPLAAPPPPPAPVWSWTGWGWASGRATTPIVPLAAPRAQQVEIETIILAAGVAQTGFL